MNIIVTVIAIVAAQRFLGMGEWLWWLFGVVLLCEVIAFLSDVDENWRS